MRAPLLALALLVAAGCGTTPPTGRAPEWEPEVLIRAPLEQVADAIADGMIRSGWHAGVGGRYGQSFEKDDFRVAYSMSERVDHTFVRAAVNLTGPHAGPPSATRLTEMKAEVKSFLDRLKHLLERASPAPIADPAAGPAPPPRPAPSAQPAPQNKIQRKSKKALDKLGL